MKFSSSVKRLSEKIYSQQAVYTAYTRQWLCHMDRLRQQIDKVRGARQLHIYGHLVTCTLDNVCGATGEPLPGLDGTHPVEFLNAANQPDLRVKATARAYGTLAMFLVAHYRADFFTPWRELNRLAVFRNRDGSAKFIPAYREMVRAIGAYDPQVSVFVSWLLEKMFDCKDVKRNTCCALGKLEDGRSQAAQIARFWKINRENRDGAVPTLIAFSTYPRGPVAQIVDPEGTSASNLNVVLDAARSYLPGRGEAFRLSGLAVTETGFKGWESLEFTAPSLTRTRHYQRYEDEQALVLNHLVNYRYDAQAPAAHPMVFINNWWLADIAMPVQGGEGTVFGPRHALKSADLDRWMTTRSGLFTSLVAGRTAKAAYSALANAIDRDQDGDGVDNITFASATEIAARDNCPLTANPLQIDSDGDGRGDACDNCPTVANPQQWDFNLNDIGNACDADTSLALRSLSVL